MDEPAHRVPAGGQGIVRPYVLGLNESWRPQRSAQQDEDPFSPRPFGGIAEPGWPGEAAQPEPAQPEPGAQRAAPGNHVQADRSLTLWWPRWPAPIAAGVIAFACTLAGVLTATGADRCAGRSCHPGGRH